MKANSRIREKIYRSNLKNWQVAAAVGISDSRFSVWLRMPLTADRRERVEKAIDTLTKVKE